MQRVYFFGAGEAAGDRDMRDLLGGKGANLAEMTRLGVPVPPGFTITTGACRDYLRLDRFPEGLTDEVSENLRRVEETSGKRFGGDTPLLVSVRSGGAVSMPGMMDTVLNLGLNEQTVEALARASGNERFAYDSYRRFISMYGNVVCGIDHHAFENVLEAAKREAGVTIDSDLPAESLKVVAAKFRGIVADGSGAPFPDDPEEQLWGAIEAVFKSWNTPRARAYRRMNAIPDDLGTGVNVMTMVYGNLGADSGTGVAFTRDPATGERRLFGEFLINAQGEDVVAGIRDPLSIDQMESLMPDAYRRLAETADRLERHYRDMQDLEFTVENGTLYLLQTRAGKRTVAAGVRIAVDLATEELIDRREAVVRIEPGTLDHLLHPMVDPEAEIRILATGLPASPGAASGQAVFDADHAVERAAAGDDVVLLRRETSPDDFEGMVAARAIVTARGGLTSHAAVVARGMGKCCVVGAKELDVDPVARVARVGEHEIREGDWLTIDGSRGCVIEDRVPTVEPELGDDFRMLMEWADEFRRMLVRANADTPADAARARKNGAEGIGLCRTEHMFFGEDRIGVMRELILANDVPGRRAAAAKLLPMQRSDFEGIFRAMAGLPVTIRLLDPPLHEFLPHDQADLRNLADTMGVEVGEVEAVIDRLTEANPMLGHRGCRLGFTYPEVTEMQARAILEAALCVQAEGLEVKPEIMVPLVGDAGELRHQRDIIERVAEAVFAEMGDRVEFMTGTMIELPRACLTAAAIAEVAEFFSFGTNDLTQTTLGLSRDDAGNFLPSYIEAGIYAADPFSELDRAGVGRLMRAATEAGRRANIRIKIGICGEHGGDPSSVEFCDELGLDYVSCSPFRVPIARLAAAHAALEH